MTSPLIIDSEEYVSLKEATEILKGQNIKLLNILGTFKHRIKKRSFIKKVDVENLVTFHKESELLRKELDQKKALMIAQYKKEIDIKIKSLKEKYGLPTDINSVIIKGEEYIEVRLAAEILDISLQKLNQLTCWNLIKRFYKKSRPWVLKSDVEKIKVEAGSGFKKICEKYDDKIKAYEAQQKLRDQELEEQWQNFRRELKEKLGN
jgi:hypothetical protein